MSALLRSLTPDSAALVGGLASLGWVVEIDLDGETVVAVARRSDLNGTMDRVAAVGGSEREVIRGLLVSALAVRGVAA